MRTFVAVDLPDALADALAALQDRFRPAEGLSFTDPGQAHVTLKFLGEVDADRTDAVQEAIAAGVGVFPSLDYVSVVWAGFRGGGDELTRLHEGIERETTAVGFDPESHEFTPHVTLARMNDARGKDRVTRLVREEGPDVGSFAVSEVRLQRSELTADGPRYSTVARFPL